MNGNDTPISGVTIDLLDAGNTVIQSLATDANGEYAFSNLVPGDYSVRQTIQPINAANGMTVAGTVANGGTAGTPTNVTTLPSHISAIVLPQATNSRGNTLAALIGLSLGTSGALRPVGNVHAHAGGGATFLAVFSPPFVTLALPSLTGGSWPE